MPGQRFQSRWEVASVVRWASKALAVAPALVVSTVVTSMVGSVLAPPAGAALFVGGLLVAVVLLFGRWSRWRRGCCCCPGLPDSRSSTIWPQP